MVKLIAKVAGNSKKKRTLPRVQRYSIIRPLNQFT
ncbi:hypothetical protein MTY_0839 [Moorella thermoacetica Y72]|uniref:Uncharacterized protein n=1 Tax=Moorella thermoacetica Y72 TaxID=1325331 RepID=A0A0S6UDQ0_NEOTH|nr:hypothetical protein MTY_0839 [Moorella thermoacetica Y72]